MSHRNSLLMKVKRGLRQLWYQDIWFMWPSAPMNWRYLLPTPCERIRLFRALWWHSRYKLPGLLWLPLELIRWGHWRLRLAPRKLRDAVAYYGLNVEARFGISIAEQESRIAYWAKGWCIDPNTAYSWQLFRPDADGLAIIYDNQTSAYHVMQNRKTGASKADHRLLGDKIALAEKLSALGVPMAETAHVSRGDWQDLDSALMHRKKLFCKLRSGNQGESAFAVWHGQNGMQGLTHDGAVLPDEDAVRNAWRILSAKGDVLIQPFLMNHSDLAAVSVDDVAVTMRVVTRAERDGFSVWWAELQIPGEVSPVGGRGFLRFPVSVIDGAVSALSRECFLKQTWQDEYDVLWQRLSNVGLVPFWAQICKHSLQAHQELPNVWAIAWDWMITPDGPIMLEGNGGWGLSSVQEQEINLINLRLVN